MYVMFWLFVILNLCYDLQLKCKYLHSKFKDKMNANVKKNACYFIPPSGQKRSNKSGNKH